MTLLPPAGVSLLVIRGDGSRVLRAAGCAHNKRLVGLPTAGHNDVWADHGAERLVGELRDFVRDACG